MRRLSALFALLAVLLVPLEALAQQQRPARMNEGWSYGAATAPTGCADGLVPYFSGTPPYLACSPTVYAPTTDTTTSTGTTVARNVSVDGGALTLTPVAPPGAATLAAIAAGTKPAGTWNVKCSWVTATGETAVGTVSANITVDGTKAITTTQPASPPPLATGWKVYSSKQGPTSSWWVTSGTIPIATTTYDDNSADAALTVSGSNSDGFAGVRVYRGTALGMTLGSTNTSVGNNALAAIETGFSNVAVGTGALLVCTSCATNLALGHSALRSVTTGNTNVAIGFSAGYSSGATPSTANAVTTGGTGTFIGPLAGLGSAAQRNNATAIGYAAYVDADNRVVLGNGSVADVWAGSTGQARLVGTGVRLVTGSRPTCDATARGLMFYVAGGAGVADTIAICGKSDADSYSWVALATF